MKIEEIKKMSVAELKSAIKSNGQKLDRMVLDHSITPMQNPSQIKQLRRQIARMKTILCQAESKAN